MEVPRLATGTMQFPARHRRVERVSLLNTWVILDQEVSAGLA